MMAIQKHMDLSLFAGFESDFGFLKDQQFVGQRDQLLDRLAKAPFGMLNCKVGGDFWLGYKDNKLKNSKRIWFRNNHSPLVTCIFLNDEKFIDKIYQDHHFPVRRCCAFVNGAKLVSRKTDLPNLKNIAKGLPRPFYIGPIEHLTEVAKFCKPMNKVPGYESKLYQIRGTDIGIYCGLSGSRAGSGMDLVKI